MGQHPLGLHVFVNFLPGNRQAQRVHRIVCGKRMRCTAAVAVLLIGEVSLQELCSQQQKDALGEPVESGNGHNSSAAKSYFSLKPVSKVP